MRKQFSKPSFSELARPLYLLWQSVWPGPISLCLPGLSEQKPCIPAPHPAHVKVSASSATPSRSLLWYEQPSPLLVIWFLAEILPT